MKKLLRNFPFIYSITQGPMKLSLVEEFPWKSPQKLNIPYFLLQSLIDSSIKFKARSLDQLAHHGLIKILMEEALHTFTIPIAWEIFRNMTAEDDIKALTYDINPSDSGEEE